jgi:hypothetical protein
VPATWTPGVDPVGEPALEREKCPRSDREGEHEAGERGEEKAAEREAARRGVHGLECSVRVGWRL